MINWTWQDTFDVMTTILVTDHYCCTALYLNIPHVLYHHPVNSKMEVREHMMSFYCLPYSCQISTLPFSKLKVAIHYSRSPGGFTKLKDTSHGCLRVSEYEFVYKCEASLSHSWKSRPPEQCGPIVHQREYFKNQ